MQEGSTGAPVRHPVAWTEADFYDPDKLDAELRRVFDICHGCRRCFNLCDTFPRLFDLIDEAESGELDTVASADFAPAVSACTLCDMCFMTKCPYVPPHEFNLDFPHLMLRYRAVRHRAGKTGLAERQLSRTDRNGRLAGAVAPLANWGSATSNRLTRPLMEGLAGIHRAAELPKFHRQSFLRRAAAASPEVNDAAPAHGRKAVLYATCYVNYNQPRTGAAARAVLARNGVETAVAYPGCCGMPQLEHGDIAAVAARAREIAGALGGWIDRGYDVVALTPSCGLMLKFEWPLLAPGEAAVKRLAEATFDISEYVVDIARTEGLAEGLSPLEGSVTLHLACHARAQNMGAKGAEMLRAIPDTEVSVIERCSGHGGSWGVMKQNFEVALKVARPVARQAAEKGARYLVSECPLAGTHIAQAIAQTQDAAAGGELVAHPIELMARAYGIAS